MGLQSDVEHLGSYLEQIKLYHIYLVNQHEAYKVFHTCTRAQISVRKKPLIIKYSKGVKMGLISNDRVPNPRSLSIHISMKQPGIILIVLNDKKTQKLDFHFWVDDLLEKKLYDIRIVKIGSIQLSIDILLNKLFSELP